MGNLNQLSVFQILPRFLQEEYNGLSDTDDWRVNDAITHMMCDAGTWETWGDVFQYAKNNLENLKNDKLNHLKGVVNLNESQSFMAIRDFLDKYYWDNGNDAPLTEVVQEVKAVFSMDPLIISNTPIWKSWKKAVNDNLKYQTIFDNSKST